LPFFLLIIDDKRAMSKAAEEGYVWEWRAFGDLRQPLVERIAAHPIRTDINGAALSNLLGQDLYLISQQSDHNIKLRKSPSSDWMLKFKLLLATETRAIELYHESNKKSFRFPVSQAVVRETTELLRVALPQSFSTADRLQVDSFTELLHQSTPPVELVLIGKIRSQYTIRNGWAELAEVTFPARSTQSISFHALERKALEEMLDEYRPGEGLDVMNYVEACRRWA
jgi:hypothetical protein